MTLTAFLLARIAEDEAAARAALQGPWELGDDAHSLGQVIGSTFTIAVRDQTAHPADLAHIARHDPARVLAECAAIRALIADFTAEKHEVVEDCWYTCASATEERDGGECCDDSRRGTGCDCGLEFRARATLAPLASIYADHPEFDPEWRLS